jgi:hypothetical protein
MSSEAIFQKLFDLYFKCQYALIEVSLPCWPYTVLYMDLLYEDVQMDYTFPKNLLQRFKKDTGMKVQATETSQAHEKLFNINKGPIVLENLGS